MRRMNELLADQVSQVNFYCLFVPHFVLSSSFNFKDFPSHGCLYGEDKKRDFDMRLNKYRRIENEENTGVEENLAIELKVSFLLSKVTMILFKTYQKKFNTINCVSTHEFVAILQHQGLQREKNLKFT